MYISIKYTVDEICEAVRQVGKGVPLERVCSDMSVSQATYRVWNFRYGGIPESEVQRLNSLQLERQRQRRIFAEMEIERLLVERSKKAAKDRRKTCI